ncbi:MAG: Fe-S cluster assembly protein HesB [Candidatus Nanohaloarchaeota archaeon QJJ-5]|nr:Fe-S cluster assembly protein HesB [Candidatus Nanohaloarchaeota archaeon QJJ-5]
MPDIDQEQIKTFRETVFSFYEEHGRDLPWRKTTDRYKIWVSEVMLQQTQVSRVVPKWTAWMEQWPTVDTLANTQFKDVLSLWKGLGYNNRARWLHNAAQKVVEEYDGEVPADVDELQELPGIGPYTANAIRIFADNADRVTVDTNIRRVFIDAFDLDEDLTEQQLYDLARRVLPEGDSRRWHNALMDYGAMEKTSQETGVSPTTTQSSFEGSRRYYRGQILDRLLDEPRSVSWLQEEFDADVAGILEDLADDGMITRQDGTVYIDD